MCAPFSVPSALAPADHSQSTEHLVLFEKQAELALHAWYKGSWSSGCAGFESSVSAESEQLALFLLTV